ncbi:MAG: SCP2 sterol-binding domain-containing protein [Cohaesibacter sp.]|nr:SCP2 sterol-binding domain-containing protein [Cohaesibacter sp.]
MTTRHLPPYVARITKFLPLAPLERLISKAAEHVAKEHPDFFERLDDYAGKSYVIMPSDLDWITALSFQNAHVQIRLSRSLEAFPNRDVLVKAPILSLLNLLDGQEDGDALFFSRDLTIEGDTEAVLALRNALDDAEIDFLYQIAQLAGPLSDPIESSAKSFLSRLQNRKTSSNPDIDIRHGMTGPYPS